MMAAVDKGEADGLGTAFAKKFSQTNFGSVPRAVKPAAEACLQVGLHGRATLSERIKSHMFEVVAGRMPKAVSTERRVGERRASHASSAASAGGSTTSSDSVRPSGSVKYPLSNAA